MVFDVNVYLDVARLLGEPFDRGAFDKQAVLSAKEQTPHPSDSAHDSLLAIATTLTGTFDGVERLEVWTSAHINDLVVLKAQQPTTAAIAEDRGLGWAAASADRLIGDLVEEISERGTTGGNIGQVQISYGTPPLSHEDGLVYRTAKEAGNEDEFYVRYCVTRDRAFREATLPGDIKVLYPHEWVTLVRLARRKVAMARMRPGT